MIGPLFHQEMLLGGRRSREHVFRWVYGGWLLLQIAWFFAGEWVASLMRNDTDFTIAVCQHFTSVFVVQHFLLLLLATPAFVAGGVSDEKTRGTLQYLLTTDLASVHIIVGKLLGRIVQVLLLALVGLPLLCFLGAFGGAEPRLILGVVLLSVEMVVGLASATLLAAVWSRHTRDAVLGLYGFAVGAALLGALLLGGLRFLISATAADALAAFLVAPLNYFNPVYVLEPAFVPGAEGTHDLFRRLFVGLFVWGGLSLGCLALAAWRLRPAYIRQLEGEGRKKGTWFLRADRPAVSQEPVRWKERHVEGLAPLPSLKRVPRWLGVAAIALATAASSGLILWSHLTPGVAPADALGLLARLDFAAFGAAFLPSEDAFLMQAVAALLLLTLLVGIRCSGSVSGERERLTWEALLLTPLTAQQLVRGKLWGIMGVSYLFVAAYAVPALAVYLLVFTLPAAAKSPIVGVLSLIMPALWLMVTLLAMYYIGATGMWSSVRSKGSWRSLLSTLGFGYVGAFLVYLPTTPILLVVALIIQVILSLIDRSYGTQLAPTTATGVVTYALGFISATCLGLMLMFWLAARLFLNGAQRWVAERERTRHWVDEPSYRSTRRRISRSRPIPEAPRER